MNVYEVWKIRFCVHHNPNKNNVVDKNVKKCQRFKR